MHIKLALATLVGSLAVGPELVSGYPYENTYPTDKAPGCHPNEHNPCNNKQGVNEFYLEKQHEKQYDGKYDKQYDGKHDKKYDKKYDGKYQDKYYNGKHDKHGDKQYDGKHDKQYDGKHDKKYDGKPHDKQYDGKPHDKQYDVKHHDKSHDGDRKEYSATQWEQSERHREQEYERKGENYHEKSRTEYHEKLEKYENIFAIDLASDRQSLEPTFWQCAAKEAKVQKVIVPGWTRDCEVGGRVETHAALTYTEARVAGIKNVDFYMDPCVGEYDNGKKCKPAVQQIEEFTSFVKSTKIQTTTLWLNIETHDGDCKAWNYAPEKNLEIARSFVHEMKKSGFHWGVRADPEIWPTIFPGREVDIDAHDLPLWAPKYDNDEQLDKGWEQGLMGGWNSVNNKQYSKQVELQGCGGNVDLNRWTTG